MVVTNTGSSCREGARIVEKVPFVSSLFTLSNKKSDVNTIQPGVPSRETFRSR